MQDLAGLADQGRPPLDRDQVPPLPAQTHHARCTRALTDRGKEGPLDVALVHGPKGRVNQQLEVGLPLVILALDELIVDRAAPEPTRKHFLQLDRHDVAIWNDDVIQHGSGNPIALRAVRPPQPRRCVC